MLQLTNQVTYINSMLLYSFTESIAVFCFVNIITMHAFWCLQMTISCRIVNFLKTLTIKKIKKAIENIFDKFYVFFIMPAHLIINIIYDMIIFKN